jgi:hypothetical protein
MEKRIYTNNVFKVFVSVFVVISLIVSLYALIVGNQPVVYAENSADDTFSIENEVKCFTDSDYLYDAENQVINTAYTIQQYKTNLAGKKIGKDDYIVQIIPKSYFYTVGNVTKIGKEYGFFIKTEICLTGYFSRVLVFDIDIGMNQYENELTYSVKPLFVFQYDSSASGVTLEKIGDEPLVTEKFYLKNVCFGLSVFNENSYNTQDVYGYNKSFDNGPVILQSRYNSKGYSLEKWAEEARESELIIIKRLLGFFDDTGLIEFASYVLDVYNDANSIAKFIACEHTSSTYNNELNIVTYKDRNSYGVNEPYYRTSMIFTSDDVVYGVDKDHYAQSILLLETLGESYRVYENIKLDIVSVGVTGNVETISSGERCEYSVHSNNYREEMESNTNELVYTLPYGKKMFRFTPEYSGEYNIKHGSSENYDYYIYQSSSGSVAPLSSLEGIYLKKGETYCIDVVNKTDKVIADTMSISLTEIYKDKPQVVKFKSGQSTAFVYKATQTEILDVCSGSPRVNIKYIANRFKPLQSYGEVGRQTVGVRFTEGDLYIIELANKGLNEETVELYFANVEGLPKTVYGDSVTKYYSYTAQKSGKCTITLKYDNPSVAISIFDENLRAVSHSNAAGMDFQNVQFSVTAGKKVYIGICDDNNTGEAINVSCSVGASAYKWRVDGVVLDSTDGSGKSEYNYEVERGRTVKIEFIVNDSVVLTMLEVTTGDYHYKLEKGNLTVYDDCWLSEFFEVKAYLTEVVNGVMQSSGYYYDSTLLIHPIIAQGYNFYVYNDQSNIGLKWNNINIIKIACTISIPTKNDFTIESEGYVGLLKDVKRLAYTQPGDIAIKVDKIYISGAKNNGVKEEFWLSNGKCGFNVPKLYVNALFAGGSGTSSNPYKISCLRHLGNLKYSNNKYYKLTTSLTLPTGWSCFENFTGTFDGGDNTLSNFAVDIETSSNVRANYALFEVNSGTIKNLKLTQINITASPYHSEPAINVAGLVGTNKGTVENCSASGLLNCNRYLSAIAGVVAENRSGTIKDCSAKYLEIFGNGDMGGVCGVSYGGLISNCFTREFTGKLYINKENRSLGGIVGYMTDGGTIEYCYNIKSTASYEGSAYIGPISLDPKIGMIVGHLNKSTMRNVSVMGMTLSSGNLLSGQRKHVGGAGNGAAGLATESTITNTNW